MDTNLITRVDDDQSSTTVMVYRHAGGAWTFVSHEDPGLDFVIRPNGVQTETYEPFGDRPHVVPEALWNQYMEDCANCTYPS